MENTSEMVYWSYNDWMSYQCSRMLDALKMHLSDEAERNLETANDPLYQPFDGMDAMAFCDTMKGNRP